MLQYHWRNICWDGVYSCTDHCSCRRHYVFILFCRALWGGNCGSRYDGNYSHAARHWLPLAPLPTMLVALPKWPASSEVRERTDNLDAVGNTTAATGKGLPLLLPLLPLWLFLPPLLALQEFRPLIIYKANVLTGLFVGAMIPFIFSSLWPLQPWAVPPWTWYRKFAASSGNSGHYGIQSQAGIRKMRAISTKASIREMMMPVPLRWSPRL